MNVAWQQLCDAMSSEGHNHPMIRIELDCGLTVQGEVLIEDAKRIFRDPQSGLPIDVWCTARPVQVVLPVAGVRMIGFPYQPSSNGPDSAK